MMKTKYIYGILAAGLMTLSTACSNNLDTDLMPIVTERTLTVDGHDAAFKLNFNAGPSTNEINVESNTLWKVEVICDGGWCSVDKVSGRGNESFSMNLRDNMIASRTCSVTVYMVDAQGEKVEGVPGSSLTITVTQDVSAVRLTPSSLTPFKPTGNERQLFEVTANVDWTLDVTYETANSNKFITIMPESGDMQPVGDGSFKGNDAATFYINVADNRTAADRKAFLNLRSDVGNFTVEISQIKAEYSFDISPAEIQVIPSEGGQIQYGVLSLSGWKVSTAADWITFSRTEGEGSQNREETIATIFPNTTGAVRSADIHFTPTDEAYQGLTVTVKQAANDSVASPAVSIPWLINGYGQTFATVQFNFYSPYTAIAEAGMEWKKEVATDWNVETVTPENDTQSTVTFELKGLEPATKYVARGFVKDADGNVTYGAVSLPFSTAALYPFNGDNPTPGNR